MGDERPGLLERQREAVEDFCCQGAGVCRIACGHAAAIRGAFEQELHLGGGVEHVKFPRLDAPTPLAPARGDEDVAPLESTSGYSGRPVPGSGPSENGRHVNSDPADVP